MEFSNTISFLFGMAIVFTIIIAIGIVLIVKQQIEFNKDVSRQRKNNGSYV